MGIKVCKFGGTSMADGKAIKQVADIINSDKDRKFVVVSAPGKAFADDIKVTDLLYQCQKEAAETGSCANTFSKIRSRFKKIAEELNVSVDIDAYLDKTEAGIDREKDNADFAASRGEYLSAVVLAAKLGYEFIDAEDIVFFDDNGAFDSEKTNEVAKERLLKADRAVIPGFYGKNPSGKIVTFSRGGSDITGSIIARAVLADLYENWTDVSGFLVCDPRIVDSPKQIKMLSYKELRELSYMGASVLHADSIFPVRKSRISINIKNTFKPQDFGTLIVPSEKYVGDGSTVTGIAGKKHFTVIWIAKSMMNAELGFARKILSILENHSVSFEHMPSGIDTLSVVIETALLKHGVLEEIIGEINETVSPDHITVHENISLIATVGHGMFKKVGTAARLFSALAKDNINVVLIDQGSSELNIIVGVADEDYEKCISAIYREFFN